MRITYITRVVLPTNAAQSLQILSMAKAFGAVLGDKFSLVAPLNPNPNFSNPQFDWEFDVRFKGELARYIFICFIAARKVLKNKENVIFTRDIMVAALVVALGGKSIYEAHKEPKTFSARIALRYIARNNKFKLIAISNALAKYYVEKYKIKCNHVLGLHDGVFTEIYDRYRCVEKNKLKVELDLPVDKKLIVHTGSLYKGGVELFEYVVKEAGVEYVFIHIGGTASECSLWSRYYRTRGIENINFIPHQPHEKILKVQMSADLLFFVTTKKSPIYWCTSPLKLFEYMATGVPILAASIGSVSEILNEENAFCFDPEKPTTIVRAFNNFLQHPIEAKKKADLCLKLANDRYSWVTRANHIVNYAMRWSL